ncbi:MAG: flippase-like domain-containing protein [Candidatus Methanoperedens sp.]|nr:flippase-like domain-containing protein [Candidatus Methanoperedens sp.]
MERFKNRNILAVILIGALIFAIFTNEIGLQKFIDLIGNTNKSFLFLALLFNLLNIITFTLSWRLLTPGKISLYKLFKFYMAGTFINNITPSFGTAGEPVKAMFLGKETGKNKAECFAGIVSVRMLNMFPFLTIGMLGAWLMFSNPKIELGLWTMAGLIFSVGLAFSMFGLIIYFYMRKDKLSSFIHSTIRYLAPFIGLIKKGFEHSSYVAAVDISINSFHGGLRNIHQDRFGLAKAALFSYLGWVFDILSIYMIFLSIGENNIHISTLIISYTISMISGWLPLFLPGGLGIVDGTMALLFYYGGTPWEIAVLATLLYRLVSYWFNTILGAFYFWVLLKPK